jgi:hypothetical protein
MDNPEKLTILGMQDTGGRQKKQKNPHTQHKPKRLLTSKSKRVK